MKSLADFESGKSAKIVSIEGGAGFLRRLSHLGIREGVVLRKVAGVSAHGPIVVKVGTSEVALGRGMAHKIMVEEV
jgi:ferrous iron transport protein A